jgi:hypothetical protein
VTICPQCRSHQLQRSHTRWWERPHRWMSADVPYRCGACGWRGWHRSEGHGPASRTSPPPSTPISPKASTTPPARTPGWRIPRKAIAVAILIIISLGALRIIRGRATAPDTRTESRRAPSVSLTAQRRSASAQDVLALVSSQKQQSDTGAYWYVEGQVKNLSHESLSNVRVFSTWFDENGSPLATDNALIDSALLLPGRTSTFKTMTRATPDMAAFRVEFRLGMGEAILTRDDSRAP